MKIPSSFSVVDTSNAVEPVLCLGLSFRLPGRRTSHFASLNSSFHFKLSYEVRTTQNSLVSPVKITFSTIVFFYLLIYICLKTTFHPFLYIRVTHVSFSILPFSYDLRLFATHLVRTYFNAP